MTSNAFEQKALALLSDALEQASADRADWVKQAAGGDEALAKRVLALLAMDSSNREALRTGGANTDLIDAPPPPRAGSYNVLDLIGRGGMGAVYRGERDAGDYDQTVAIKIIRPGVLSDSLIARFERERQTLADLAHPNIARLLDGGALDDGSPYLVMEYVDGEPITDWANTSNLDLNDRLWLFTDACRAVRHAHQNLIVHRDITPSNVLVTKSGAVKLIDFGIAKPQTGEQILAPPEQGQTSLASLSFTPGYGAPERQMGAPANTLSDIYSLGKLLEDLVSDKPVSADLSAIISKASAVEPENRYASVDALLDDLASLRNNYPVEARGGGTTYRFGKYLKRNGVAVAAGSLALAGLVSALVITQTQYSRAEEALVHANARFEQARGLSKAMIVDVYDAIEHLPGSLDARENLAGIVKDYVGELASDPNAPTDVLMDVAVQNTRLSDLYGGLGVSNLGDTETSYTLLLQAEDALTKLLDQEPDNVDAIDEMGWVKRLKANQQLTYQLDVDGARQTNKEGLEIVSRGLTLPGAEDTRLYFRFWNSRTDRVKILMYGNDYPTAIADARRYREGLQTSTYDEEPQRRNSRTAYFARLEGEALADTQQWADAIEPLEFAIPIYDEILSKDKSQYYYLLQKMTTLGPLVLAYLKLGNGEPALARAKEALDIARTLLEGDPRDAAGRGYVATQLEMLGRVEAEFGTEAAALGAITEALEVRRGLIFDFPGTNGHRRDLAGTLKTAGVVYNTLSREAEACDASQQSLAELQALNEAGTLTDFERDVWIPEVEGNLQAFGCVPTP